MGRSDYPALYQAASDASRDGQNTYKRLVQADLALVVTGAMLGALAFLVPTSYAAYFAAVAAIVLLGSVVAKYVNRQRTDDKEWFDGRAVAESVKTLTWRYMMRLEPFEDDTTCDQKFIDELDATREARSGLQYRVGSLGEGAEQITPRMREVRKLPVEERRDLYVKERLEDQARWYGKKSEDNRRIANRLFWAALAAQFVALALAVWRVASPSAGLSLVGPLLALAAAFTAWTQLGRNDELSKSYALANQELLSIKALADTVGNEQELVKVVRDGEGAISREHTMWIAKRGKPLPQQAS
jgi:SMODS and SLOG-associating 2TM effector domain 3/SMODS and SLOG-associating 2TM effector domain 1